MFRRFISSTLSSAGSLFSRKEQSEENTNFQYALSADEKKQLKQSEDKPKVVALYDEHDGSGNADLAIQHFESKGIDVIKVSPDEGLNHPTFTNTSINGIYLPGGSDIPINDDKDPRKKFEGQLTELAHTKDIPLLGICRGEQAIGHHNGSEVKDLSDFDKHYDHDAANNMSNPDLNNRVVVETGSQLHAALQHKLKSDEGQPIEYHVTCLHHQHVEDNLNNKNVEVTGRNPYDHTIESIEKKTGKYFTVGFQHHPEVTISSYNEKRQENISKIEADREDARLKANFFDPEDSVYTEFKSAQKIQEARMKPRDEKAALAEMGFFTSQVKKSFLEQQQKPQPEKQDSNSDVSIPMFEFW